MTFTKPAAVSYPNFTQPYWQAHQLRLSREAQLDTFASSSRSSSASQGIATPLLPVPRQDWRSLPAEMGGLVTELTGWKCDTQGLRIAWTDADQLTRALQKDMAQRLRAPFEQVRGNFLERFLQRHNVHAALLGHNKDLLLARETLARGSVDATRAVVFRQLVRLAQRQEFPDFFAESDHLLQHVWRHPTDTQALARLWDRTLWAEGCVEYLASQAAPRHFPNHATAQTLLDWLAEWIASWVCPVGASRDDMRRAIEMFDRIYHHPLPLEHDNVRPRRTGQAVVDTVFRERNLAEGMVYGRWDQPLHVPFEEIAVVRNHLAGWGGYRLFPMQSPRIKEVEGPEIGVEAVPLEAARRAFALGDVQRSRDVLYQHVRHKKDDVAALELLGNIEHASLRNDIARHIYQRVLTLNPDSVVASEGLVAIALLRQGALHTHDALSVNAEIPVTSEEQNKDV